MGVESGIFLCCKGCTGSDEGAMVDVAWTIREGVIVCEVLERVSSRSCTGVGDAEWVVMGAVGVHGCEGRSDEWSLSV